MPYSLLATTVIETAYHLPFILWIGYLESASTAASLALFFGLSLGVAIGVGVGVLVAPTSGGETRRRLRDSTGRLREHAERVKDRALGAARRAQDEIQESTSATTGERSFANDLGAR